MPNSLSKFKARAFARPDVKNAYDELADEFELLDELLKARTASGLTQAEVAALIGTTQSAIARLESPSSSHSPSVGTLQKYARALGYRVKIKFVKDTQPTQRTRKHPQPCVEMNTPEYSQLPPIPLGFIEPHAGLLSTPNESQLLYKVMTVENLLRSLTGNYLHFNRVDSYPDFPNVDKNDGRQLPKDRPANASAKFEKDPKYSAAHYYDQSRARTYACCFSTQNSDYIWNNYGNGSTKGKVCIVFEFGKLRAMLNRALGSEGSALLYEGNICHQIFSVNYGLIDYVNWDNHQTNQHYLSNPILYTYIKANSFCEENELRISLSSAIGMGKFALKDGTLMQFQPALQLGFDFREAIANGAIQEILLTPDTNSRFLTQELSKLRIEPVSMPAQK